MELTVVELSTACLIVASSALLQGSVGFGFSLLAAPLLMLINPLFVPGPLIIPAFAQIFMIAFREREAIDLSGLKWAFAGMVPGTLLGAIILTTLPATPVALLLGGLVLTAVATSLLGFSLGPSVPLLSGAGLLSGIMASVSTISGPPLALVYQNAGGAKLRSTLAAYFLGATIFSILSLIGVGYLGWQHILWSLPLIPSAVFGVWISKYTVAMLDRGYTRSAVLGLSGLAAIAVIFNAII